MASRRRWLVGAFVCTLVWAGGAAAGRADERGIDPNQGQSLVEVNLPNKAAAMRLQLEADTLRRRVQRALPPPQPRRVGDRDRLRRRAGPRPARRRRLRDRPHDRGPEDPGSRRAEQREAGVRKEQRADAAALDEPITITSHEDELVILRADYFENYTGRYLSVEAKTRLASVDPANGAYTGPALSLSWNSGAGTEIDSRDAQHELEHRPRHDAGHLHRAPPARADRRRRHQRPAGADADPDRVEHRPDDGGHVSHLARRRPAADGRTAS